jgi:2-C-methyl-D-erythritol 4-phosphate cytidylyltransferase/2-C-methyl-D-erythritol 2,4-cyclodiphosphate synthase
MREIRLTTTGNPTPREATAAEQTATAPPRTAAVLPAAGQARRFGSGENKIWASLAGRAVLEWTLSAFDAHPAIASIVLVANAEEIERVRAAAAAFPKVTAVVAGGDSRAESVKNGLDAVLRDTEIVLVHDAARPLLSTDLIDRIIAATAQTGAAVPGLLLSDTVKRVDACGHVRATVPRSEVVHGDTLFGLTAVQTPQGARVERLRDAYLRFDFAHAEPTDEASLLEAMGAPVAVVPGDPTNLKITRPEDLALAELLLQGLGVRVSGFGSRGSGLGEKRAEPQISQTAKLLGTDPMSPSTRYPDPETRYPEFRTGFGYDVHAFAPPEAGRQLFLGGVAIPHDRGLDGHSDADALLHAVCDALLGAASLGDIGVHFPNTDPAYKGISSLRLLEIVGKRLTEAGWRVVNVDATVVAEAPKLTPYRAAMQQAMADCLHAAPSRFSVKATTSEKMGFIGRQEGIACWAVATVVKQNAPEAG